MSIIAPFACRQCGFVISKIILAKSSEFKNSLFGFWESINFSLSFLKVLYIFVFNITPGQIPMHLIFGASHFDIDLIKEIIAPFADA